MDEKALQQEIQNRIRKTLAPIFSRYELDLSWLDSSMKWKPQVLVIGSYSSGKSTFINELLGVEVQRTGQAPTDDSFTVITHEGEEIGQKVPGSTLVNDERYPYAGLKSYGEGLISHLCLKNVPASLLESVAIIDTPGMIDSTAERDRGYRYLEVVGDLAAMADMIVLMFDPHKAGTIKETFKAIRDVLPGRTVEDRVVYVLSRIDECENLNDLVRSYGTLCWNISQMTGRKDMPHIFLTYSSKEANLDRSLQEWPQEREELKEKIGSARAMRINHILENVDRKTGELEMVCEALYSFARRTRRLFRRTFKWSAAFAAAVLVLVWALIQGYIPFQEQGLMHAEPGSMLSYAQLGLPILAALAVLCLGWVSFSLISFPRLKQQTQKAPDSLLQLDTDYRKNLWTKLKSHVLDQLQKRSLKQHLFQSKGSLEKVRSFIRKDLKEYYSKIGQPLPDHPQS